MPDFLRPGAQYIAPTSGLFFSQVIEQPSLSTFLPCRAYADRFLQQYFVSVHPIATCAQRASLEETYAAFWVEVNEGLCEPRASTQSIVFAALFSGAVAMDENDVMRELGGFAKENWVHSLKMGTETALSKANFLRTTKMETMQAFIIYMVSRLPSPRVLDGARGGFIADVEGENSCLYVELKCPGHIRSS